MAIFNEAVALVLHHEGGYVNDPDDRGGETKYGISKRAYPDLDIANLTVAEAEGIYFRDYWVAINASSMPPPVALMTFDAAVNMGIRRAARFLQKEAQCTPDGIVGPQTLKAVTAAYRADPQGFCKGLYTRRQSFYERLKTFAKFGRGWSRRNQEIYEEALKWIEIS